MKKGQLTIVFGGQFGSEGKGQIAAYLAQRQFYDYAVRIGGPNAGHTFMHENGVKQVVQTIPVPCMVNVSTVGVIGSGGLIIPEILNKELLDAYEVVHGGHALRLHIDASVAVITPEHMEAEASLKKSIGSTGEGVGKATADRVMRNPKATILARPDVMQALWDEGSHTARVSVLEKSHKLLNNALVGGARIMIEGTQGAGLSLLTSGFYPFCTSRECTPMGLLAETGIQPKLAEHVETIMVARTYPIRVGGNSGPLPREITWDQLREATEGYVSVPEITTVTKKQRRIAEIDYEELRETAVRTAPSAIALTFFDYWFPEIANARDASALQSNHWRKIEEVERRVGVPVKYLSTGFGSVIPTRVTA